MGLDIHVMPLGRFLGGRYQSPLEKMLGSKVERIGSAKPDADPQAAAELLGALKMLIARQTGGSVADWDETSESVEGVQYAYQAYTDLRGFAAHQDYPRTKGWLRKQVLPFQVEEDTSRYRGLVTIWNKGMPTAYPHLIIHADTHGYWLPVPFKSPILLDKESYLVAGSSIRLLEELDRLAPLLGMTRDWGELEDGKRASEDGDPLGSVKYGWSVLHYAARMSVQHRMPMIFDG